MKYGLGLFLFLSGSLYAQTSYVPMARTLNDSGSELRFRLEYFKPTSVVTEDGVGEALTENNNSTHINLGGSYLYGLTKNFEMMVKVNARSVQSNFSVDSGTDAGQYSLSKSGLESIGIGFKFGSEEEDRASFAIEGYYDFRMFSNLELDADTVLTDTNLGDDTREYAIGGAYQIRTTANNFFEFRALYRSPAEYLSTEIFSEAQYSIVWDYVAMYIGLENVYSLESSPYASDRNARPNTAVVNSELYNSIDRAWTAPYLGMNIALGKSWRLEGRFTQVYTGNSTDIGPRILVGLAKRTEVEKEYVKRDAKFKEYRMEGVVVKITKSRKLAVIDLGEKDGLKQGMRVDFYYFDYVGGNKLIARGVVYRSKGSKAVVKITKRYGRRRIQEGTVVRAGEFQN